MLIPKSLLLKVFISNILVSSILLLKIFILESQKLLMFRVFKSVILVKQIFYLFISKTLILELIIIMLTPVIKFK